MHWKLNDEVSAPTFFSWQDTKLFHLSIFLQPTTHAEQSFGANIEQSPELSRVHY